jgi:periplasmic divalent cation tolerance protein
MEPLLVMTHFPDEELAQAFAREALAARWAACINILPPCRSLYRWQGKLEMAQEIPLFIKTTRAHYAALEAAIVRWHPFEIPEIVALPLVGGLPAYLAWLGEETAPC